MLRHFPFGSLLALLVLTLAFCAPALAQPYTLSVTDSSGPQGGLVSVSTLLDVAGESVGAWSYGACHDPTLLDIVQVDPGATTQALDPDFYDTSLYSDSWTSTVIVDLFWVEALPPGLDYELDVATYELLEEGNHEVCICTTGQPAVEPQIVQNDQDPFDPVTECGSISAGPSPFLLYFEDNVAGTVGGDVEISVFLDNQLGAAEWAFSVCNDENEMQVTEIEPGAATLQVDPDFYTTMIVDGGWTTGVVIDIGASVEHILPGNGRELYVATYELISVGNHELCVCTAGMPPVAPVVVTPNPDLEDYPPETECGSVLSGLPFNPNYFRGDANGDTVYDVADVVYTLQALFSSAAPPIVCDDAADANDDGMVDIGDAIFSVSYFFLGGSVPPPPPFPGCGEDPTSDMLDCGEYSCPGSQ